jgi:hypothetical protein
MGIRQILIERPSGNPTISPGFNKFAQSPPHEKNNAHLAAGAGPLVFGMRVDPAPSAVAPP